MFNYYFDNNRVGHEATVRLFEATDNSLFIPFTSEYSRIEIQRAQDPKRSNMLSLFDLYKVTVFSIDPKYVILANIYARDNFINRKFFYDALHITAATVNSIDFFLSFNAKHMNNDKTKSILSIINLCKGYQPLTNCGSKELLDARK
jgi:hypothetical protein